MKKIKIFFMVVPLMFVVGCTADLDGINDRLDDLEERVGILEELCDRLNADISSLETIVAALQEGDYITGVVPITEDGEIVGYEIHFAKSETISIYNGTDGRNGADGIDGQDGKDGTDGSTPQIGVMQDTDGKYYWTLDGEWLLDGDGNRIPVRGEDGADGADGEDGTDGKDGVTPEFKIEEEYWYISYDGGQTWTRLGKAVGEDGADGQNVDGLFSKVEIKEDVVVFYLSDGTTLTLPIVSASALSISFNEEDLAVLYAGREQDIRYTVGSDMQEVSLEVLTSGDIKARIVPADACTGVIEVRAGEELDEFSSITVIVMNGTEVLMRSLDFGITVMNGTDRVLPFWGGETRLEFLTDREFEVFIPEAARDWLSMTSVSGEDGYNVVVINAGKNMTLEARTIEVEIRSVDGIPYFTYEISQEMVDFSGTWNFGETQLVVSRDAAGSYTVVDPFLGWSWDAALTDGMALQLSSTYGATVDVGDPYGDVVSVFCAYYASESDGALYLWPDEPCVFERMNDDAIVSVNGVFIGFQDPADGSFYNWQGSVIDAGTVGVRVY